MSNVHHFRVKATVPDMNAPVVVCRATRFTGAMRAAKKFQTAVIEAVYDNSVIFAKINGQVVLS